MAGALSLAGYAAWNFGSPTAGSLRDQQVVFESRASDLARDLAPVLKIHDKSLTKRALESLGEAKWARGAAVYGVSGKMFTVFAASQDAKRFLPVRRKFNATTSESGTLFLVTPLIVDGKRWGDLLVVAQREPVPAAPKDAPLFAGAGALALLAAGGVLVRTRKRPGLTAEPDAAFRYPVEELDAPTWDASSIRTDLQEEEWGDDEDVHEPEVDLEAPVVFHKPATGPTEPLDQLEELEVPILDVPTVKVRTGPASIPPAILATSSQRKEQVVDFTTEDLQSIAERGVPTEDPEDGASPRQDEDLVLFLVETEDLGPNLQILNPATLASESGHDPRVAKARLKNFLISSRLEVITMMDAQAAGRTDRLFLEAQALHRCAAQLGAEQLTEILDALMNAVSMNHLDALPLLLKRIDHSHTRLLRAVERRLKLAA